MNKRYMDFVPSNAVKKTVVTPVVQEKPVVEKPVEKPVIKKPVTRPTMPVMKPAAKKVSAPAPVSFSPSSRKGEVRLGVIEEVVKSEKKVEIETPVEKPVEKPKKDDGKEYKVPKSPFINQEKVVKRPLSKNVYHKNVVVPKEEPKGPVTIIAKPEKDAHVSLIVAVILTIILGAAAGTVAFLLLPK